MPDFIASIAGSNQIGIYISVMVFVAAVMVFLALALVLGPVVQTQRRLSQELAGHLLLRVLENLGGRPGLGNLAGMHHMDGIRY